MLFSCPQLQNENLDAVLILTLCVCVLYICTHIYVLVCVGTRAQHQCLPLSLSTLNFETESLVEYGVNRFGWNG